MSDPHASVAAPVDDEPKTPMWLPALGAALFIAAGLWWAVTPAPLPPVEAPAASATAPATVAAPTPPPPPPPTAMPVPSAAPAGTMAKVKPGRGPGAIPSNLPPAVRQQIQNIQNNPRP